MSYFNKYNYIQMTTFNLLDSFVYFAMRMHLIFSSSNLYLRNLMIMWSLNPLNPRALFFDF